MLHPRAAVRGLATVAAVFYVGWLCGNAGIAWTTPHERAMLAAARPAGVAQPGIVKSLRGGHAGVHPPRGTAPAPDRVAGGRGGVHGGAGVVGEPGAHGDAWPFDATNAGVVGAAQGGADGAGQPPGDDAHRDHGSASAAVGVSDVPPIAAPTPDAAASDARSVATPTPPGDEGLAPAPFDLPAVCRSAPRYSAAADAECSAAVLALADGRDASCRGAASRGASAPQPTVIHTLATGAALPTHAARMIRSFLATQCCDAELWVWRPRSAVAAAALPADVAAAATAALPADVAAAADGRVHFRTLDLFSEFEAWGDDFRGLVNDTMVLRALGAGFASDERGSDGVDGSGIGVDASFAAGFAKVALLYRYGGVFVDLRIVLLRDWRPLLRVAESWGARSGDGPLVGADVLSLRPRPAEATAAVLRSIMEFHDASPDALSRAIDDGHGGLGSRDFSMLPGTLFGDFPDALGFPAFSPPGAFAFRPWMHAARGAQASPDVGSIAADHLQTYATALDTRFAAEAHGRRCGGKGGGGGG